MPFQIVCDITDITTLESPVPFDRTKPSVLEGAFVVEENRTVDQREVHRPGWPRFREQNGVLVSENEGLPVDASPHAYRAGLYEWVQWRLAREQKVPVTKHTILDIEELLEWTGRGARVFNGTWALPPMYAARGYAEGNARLAHERAVLDLFSAAFTGLQYFSELRGIYDTPRFPAGPVWTMLNTMGTCWYPVAHGSAGESYMTTFKSRVREAVAFRRQSLTPKPIYPFLMPFNTATRDKLDLSAFCRAARDEGADGIVIYGRIGAGDDEQAAYYRDALGTVLPALQVWFNQPAQSGNNAAPVKRKAKKAGKR